jgi:CheY-like chemotaxis protein
MTANAMAHQQASYLAAGMDGAIAKPLSPLALTQAIALAPGTPAALKAS